MKIICEREKLLKAINAVVRGVPTRTTMPILEGIYLQTNSDKLKLTTYDLELGIEFVIDATIEEEGATVVNAIMFSEIIRKLPDTEIHISINDKNLLEIFHEIKSKLIKDKEGIDLIVNVTNDINAKTIKIISRYSKNCARGQET